MAISTPAHNAAEAELRRQVLHLRVIGKNIYAIATLLDLTPQHAEHLLHAALAESSAERARSGNELFNRVQKIHAERLAQQQQSSQK